MLGWRGQLIRLAATGGIMLGRDCSRRAVLAAGLLAVGMRGNAAWGTRSARAQSDQVVLTDGHRYDAYLPAATKPGQFAQYTCEFDAAWVICKTLGRGEVSLEDQVAIVGLDQRIEPYVEETPGGYVIYGGAIDSMFSGDYTSSYLARARSQAIRKVFDAYGLPVEPVADRPSVEEALGRGGLVWVKSTVDYQPFEPVTWITPEGQELPGVLGNEHAVTVIGYNADVVVIRDLLGPTGSNWERQLEYEVPWETFLAVWDGHGRDGVAVFPASVDRARSTLVPGVEISGALGERPEFAADALPPIVPVDNVEATPAPASVIPVEITGSL